MPDETFHVYHGTPDPRRPRVLVITGSDVFSEKMNLDCWYRYVADTLIDMGYQIVFLGGEQSRQSKDVVSVGIKTEGFRSRCWRSSDHSDNKQANLDIARRVIQDEFIKMFGPFQRIQILGGKGYFILPLQPFVPAGENRYLNSLKNEFHDELSDPDVDRWSKQTTDDFWEKVSATGYSTVRTYLYFSTVREIMSTNMETVVDKFIIDPSTFYPWFMIQWPSRTNLWYFEQDTRGQRNFKPFPMAQLLHCVFERDRENPLDRFLDAPQHDRLFFFAGSIIYDKGRRSDKWYQYFHDLDLPDSDLYVPLRGNGVNQSYKENKFQRNMAKKKHGKLFHDIQSHPLWKPAVLADELKDLETRYRYTMILSCVSHSDSLNFRPVNYAKDGVLPFLDPEYDPECLQIPWWIQDRLIVNTSSDIIERIRYFEQNPVEREQLLTALQELFDVSAWLSISNDEIKRELSVYFS